MQIRIVKCVSRLDEARKFFRVTNTQGELFVILSNLDLEVTLLLSFFCSSLCSVWKIT